MPLSGNSEIIMPARAGLFLAGAARAGYCPDFTLDKTVVTEPPLGPITILIKAEEAWVEPTPVTSTWTDVDPLEGT